MIADDDHRNATKTAVWPIVLAVVLGFAFVGSLVGVFVIAYFSVGDPPSGPVFLDGQPAWRDQLQPGDRIIEIRPSNSPPDFSDLQQEIILSDGDDFEFQVIRDGETMNIRLKPKSEAQQRTAAEFGIHAESP